MTNFCNLHQRLDCTLCDECGHEATSHLNAHSEPEPVAAFIFANATCWAENICQECAPALHNDALVRGLGQPDGEREPGGTRYYRHLASTLAPELER